MTTLARHVDSGVKSSSVGEAELQIRSDSCLVASSMGNAMKLMLRYTILVIVLCIFQDGVHAQTTPPTTSVSSTASASHSGVAPTEVPELVAARQQIKLLETQLRVTREFQSDILSTVHWALGGVFVVVGLLLGVGWYANIKLYERDKEALRAELSSTVAKTGAKLELAVASQTTEAKESLLGSMKSIAGALLDPVRDSVRSLERKQFLMEFAQARTRMHTNASDSMALTDAIAVLELCQKGREDEFPDTINFMLKKLDKGGKLTASEITKVNAIVDSLPGHYKALTDRLRAKLVASDIFP